MLTALTAYFYFLAVALTLAWIAGLFIPVSTKPRPKESAGQRWATGIGGMLLAAIVTAPWYYLQSIGLEALGFPGWWAWATFALWIVAMLSNLARNAKASGLVSGFGLLSLLLAWHGLQSLT